MLGLCGAYRRAVAGTRHLRRRGCTIVIRHPRSGGFLIGVLSRSSRVHSQGVLTGHVGALLSRCNIPRFLGGQSTFLFGVCRTFKRRFSFVTVPVVGGHLHVSASRIVVGRRHPRLAGRLTAHFGRGVKRGIGLLNRIILNGKRTSRHCRRCLRTLRSPSVGCVSIGVSKVCTRARTLGCRRDFPRLISQVSTLCRGTVSFPCASRSKVGHSGFVGLSVRRCGSTRFALHLFGTMLGLPRFGGCSTKVIMRTCLPSTCSFRARLLRFTGTHMSKNKTPVGVHLIGNYGLRVRAIVSSLGN